MRKRKFTAAFKRKVVLEALRGDEAARSIAARHDVHPTQASKWKAEAREGLLEVFARGGKKPATRSAVFFSSLMCFLVGCDARGPDDFASQGQDSSIGQELRLDMELAHVSSSALEFSSIRGVDIDSRGRIYVVDGFRGGIRVLSSTLSPLREVGRDGEGPGEFRTRQIQILNGDSLAVYDSQLGRVTVFEPDNFAVARTFRLPEYGNQTPSKYWAIGKNRFLAIESPAFYAGAGVDDDVGRQDIVTASVIGAIEKDTILTMPSADFLVARAAGSVAVSSHPYGTEPLLQPVDSLRIAYGHTREARILVLGLGGDTVADVLHPTETVNVLQQQFEEDLARIRNQELAATFRRGAPYQWPAIVALVADDSSRVWMSVRAAANADSWPLFVFDTSGRLVATSSLPAGG